VIPAIRIRPSIRWRCDLSPRYGAHYSEAATVAPTYSTLIQRRSFRVVLATAPASTPMQRVSAVTGFCVYPSRLYCDKIQWISPLMRR
jgi:hypothetical protein